MNWFLNSDREADFHSEYAQEQRVLLQYNNVKAGLQVFIFPVSLSSLDAADLVYECEAVNTVFISIPERKCPPVTLVTLFQMNMLSPGQEFQSAWRISIAAFYSG